MSTKTLPLSGLSILVVEDAYLIALEAQRIVEEAGAERVLLASKVEEVQALLESGVRTDVCVLDLKLGEEDATPLIREILDSGIALLVATGFDSMEPDVDVPVLRKPYEEAEFVEAVRAACRKP